MKHKYFSVTIQGLEPVIVRAEAGKWSGLGYLDEFDYLLMYRYFNPSQVKIARRTYQEAERARRQGTRQVDGFGPLHKLGSWR